MPNLGVVIVENNTPPPLAAQAAAVLAPVAGQVAEVREKAQLGGLKLDVAEAKVLLATIDQIRDRAADLVTESAQLDRPLKFGDNWVGQIMAERLRGVASDDSHSIAAVLATYRSVLDDLAATVRAAAGIYVLADEDSAEQLSRAVQRFGVEG